ncbi:MAG: hypothetical protein VW881_00925 [Alphaproteobacteria bacterium]|jgi:hypothetical protein
MSVASERLDELDDLATALGVQNFLESLVLVEALIRSAVAADEITVYRLINATG